jgi:hypothetical protein
LKAAQKRELRKLMVSLRAECDAWLTLHAEPRDE